MMQSSIQNPKNMNIELLRVCACIAVVGLHTLQKDISVINSSLYYLCGFAVPIFFMLSGYFLMHKDNASIKYSMNKIICIIRVVIIWNGLHWLAKEIAKMISLYQEPWGYENLMENILGGFIQRGAFWQFWYLGALIIIYLLLPILTRISNQTRKKLVILLLGIMFTFQICSVIWGMPVQKNIVQSLRLWTWLFYFMLGGMFRDFQRDWNTKVSLRNNFMLLAVLTIIMLFYYNFVGRLVVHESIEQVSVLHAEYFYDSPIMVFWVGLIFLTVMRLRLKKNILIVISKISGLSMGVYIIHPFVMRLLQKVYCPVDIWKSLVFFVTVLISSFFIAWGISKMPFGKWLIQL